MNDIYFLILTLILFLLIIIFVAAKLFKNKSIIKKIIFSVLSFTVVTIVSYFCYINFSMPIFKLKGNEKIDINVFDKYVDEGYILNKKLDVKVSNKVDTDKIGNYEVIYTLKYYNKELKLVRNVNVVDSIKPIIELKGNSSIDVAQGVDYVEKGFIATDNYDGDITDKVEVINNIKDEIGTYEVIYKVKDSSGNESVIKRTVTRTINNNGVVYLTFDDGPSSTTYKILDILDKQNIKATFFVVNYSSGYNDILKRIVNDGHTLAIHSYTHNYKVIYSSSEAYFEDLYKLRNKIKDTTGVESNIVRFPGGSSNTISSFNKGIMTKLVKEVKEKGFHYFDWNSDSRDAGGVRNSDDVYNNVMKDIYPNRANVVLMHDHANNNNTINALNRIIDDCKAKGYTFDKITYDTPMVVHRVNN